MQYRENLNMKLLERKGYTRIELLVDKYKDRWGFLTVFVSWLDNCYISFDQFVTCNILTMVTVNPNPNPLTKTFHEVATCCNKKILIQLWISYRYYFMRLNLQSIIKNNMQKNKKRFAIRWLYTAHLRSENCSQYQVGR